MYQAYAKRYAREGQRAVQDALGAAAAATGGIPSSYAVTAAAQAGDYYASQMADKIPELYQQAYSRYINELTQYNTDRDFQYGQFTDDISHQAAARQEALQNALYGAQYAGDYSDLQRPGYKVDNNPVIREEKQKKWERAQLAASMGDYSLLRELGVMVDPSYINQDIMYNLAVANAKLGNPTYLGQMTRRYF